jgi:asparagine synthase (glutamine-hydrolysing)
MCGIAGGVFWGGRIDPVAGRRAVETMVAAVSHRGPDGQGVYSSAASEAPTTKPFAVLGHTRLAIIDTSAAGAQPMGGPGAEPWITFNGEIYNFASLRCVLEAAGSQFRSNSDTEVILRGYSAWGLDTLARLRGMYAFALWDERRQRLLLARDRVGVKPMYVYRGDGLVLFSSEVRALLATDLVPRRVDPTALWDYLGYQTVPAPRTLVDGVRAMEPASWATVSATGEFSSGIYWRMLDPARQSVDVSVDEAHSRVGDKLRDAVAAHMVSDVPVAAFLSGGIDSSAVVALMSENGVRPRTFSIGFDEQAFDESQHAALVAHTFRAEHTHVPLRGHDLLDQLPAALRAMDQPTGDAVNTYVVSGAVRERGIKVALSGLGGDEVFGGYPSFRRLTRVADVSRIWGRLPASFRSFAAQVVRSAAGTSITATKSAALLESDGEISSMLPLLRQLLSAPQRQMLLSDSVLAGVDETSDPYDELLASVFRNAPSASSFAQISFAEARTYMHDVLLRDTDQMSMAHALEVRVPLLDHELIELVMALPDGPKQSRTTPKPLLVESMRGLLPMSIVHRPKQGFTLPFDPWMRGPLKALCEERLGERGLAGRGLMKPDALAGLWRSFIAGGRDVSWSRVWALVVLDAWLDQHGLAT